MAGSISSTNFVSSPGSSPVGDGIGNELNVLQQAQNAAQEEFLAFQVASQNQNLIFEATREAVQQIETTTEAAFDEAEKYRANIASAQA